MITLRGMTWDHPRGYQPLIATADLYAQRYGVQVEWEKRSLKDFGDAPIDALADRYDVLIIDHPHTGLAAASGCLVALDEYVPAETLNTLAEQSAGLSHASYTYAGRQWALAIDTAFQISAYRPDLCNRTALPDQWNGVLDLGRRLRRTRQYVAIPLCPTDAICCFLSLCASLGDPPGQDEGILVSREIGQQALEWLLAISAIAHPRSLDWNPIGMLDYMSEADDVVYCPLSFGYTNYARDGYRKKLIRFHNIPNVKGALLGGTGFAVSSRCAFPREATAYGMWLCSAEIQRTLYLENGGQPGNIVAWRDEAANRLTHGFFTDTMETLEQAYLRPRHYGFVSRFQEPAGYTINTFLRERGNISQCLETLSKLYVKSLEMSA